MFGIVVPDRGKLTEAQWERYHGLYCGLCRTLQRQYGLVPRMTLSYDLTFLIVLLSSLYEPEEHSGKNRCMVHPFRKTAHSCSTVTEYAAAMNTALAYYKALDDWHDDHSLFALLQSVLLRPAVKTVETQYAEKCACISQCLSDLTNLEKENILDADAAAACFGKLTGELFVMNSTDHWAKYLRKLGDALGRFIYLSDALIDLADDQKRGKYNPLSPLVFPGAEEDFLPTLQLIAGDCAAELERMPLVQDIDILRNIIYSGLWTSYTAHKKKKRKE